MGSESGDVCNVNLNAALTAEQRERYQNAEVIRELLGTSRTIAVVGLSVDETKASHIVASYLDRAGYTIIPVNPRGEEILGKHVYPDLASIPGKVDIVDVFRPSNEVAGIVDQAIAIKAGAVWTQLRVMDVAAAEKASAAGLKVVMDKCLKIEHAKFRGGLRQV